jgi:hypothetical protein
VEAKRDVGYGEETKSRKRWVYKVVGYWQMFLVKFFFVSLFEGICGLLLPFIKKKTPCKDMFVGNLP